MTACEKSGSEAQTVPQETTTGINSDSEGDMSGKMAKPEEKGALLKANLECRSLTGPDEDPPRNEIALVLQGERHVIGEVNSCETIEKQDYERYQIPDAALDAAGGWFAGAGDYFYLILKAEEYIVMAGWQDELQEDAGFHYEEKARFKAY